MVKLSESKAKLQRLYIDEVGNHAMSESLPENERYLTLFGIWTSFDSMINSIQPEMNAIKFEFFQGDPDTPVIFHRKDIARFRGPFTILAKDKERRMRFGNRMLQAYAEWDYTAVAVMIDKLEHLRKYRVYCHAPYHYCLEVLIERYVLALQSGGLSGDVMIEARDPTLDGKLKESFTRIYNEGSRHLPAELMQSHLTSSEIKLKKKSANVAGLQIADLLAHPAYYDVLCDFGVIEKQESEYGRAVAKILNESKYHRNSHTGEIKGYGKKLLP
jgi:hypothetical protein